MFTIKTLGSKLIYNFAHGLDK